LRSYLRQRDGDLELVDQTRLWNHPLLAPWFPHAPIDRLRAMRRDQPRFLAALDALPRTLCHLDLHPANLFGDNDADSTTAIDWSFVGIGAIGEDAGNLVPDAVLDFHVAPARLDDLYETVADGYTAGLRDSGWRGPDTAVRLGMAATIAAKYAWIAPAMLRAISEDRADLNRRAIAESLEWWAPSIGFLLDRADEARALI
jgi:thiamine kinase-like enzyme